MAGPNFSSIQDLAGLTNLDFPAYMRAQEQFGLQDQFNQQNLAIGGQDLQSKMLGNLFQQQADPMRLQALGLENQGKQNANTISGVNARIAGSTEQEALAAKRADLLAKASDDELKALRTQAEKEYESEDPAVRARGEKKLMASVAEWTRRNKTEDAVKVAGAKSDDRMALEKFRQESMDGRNQASIDARAAAAAAKGSKAAGGILTAVQNGKMGFEKAATAFEVMAQMEDDPAKAQQFADLSKRFAQANITQRNATAGTKVDLNTLGIKTNQFDLGVGGAPMGIGGGSINGAGPNLGPTNNGRGDPPAGSGIVTPADEAHRKAVMNISQIEEEYMRNKDPAARKVLAGQIAEQRAIAQQTAPQAAGQPAKPQTPAAPAKPKLSEVQNMYPGVPAEKLREAYKKKFGVDLQ